MRLRDIAGVRFLSVVFLVTAGFLGAFSPNTAKAVPVDLELQIAVDLSGSVSGLEAFRIRAGLVNAFQSQELSDAIDDGAIGSIAVQVILWGDGSATPGNPPTPDPFVAIDWTQVDNLGTGGTTPGDFATQILALSVASHQVVQCGEGRLGVEG